MTTNQSSNLRPCPFCGAMPIGHDDRYMCSTPGCVMQEDTISAENWNTRPIEDELQKRIAELEAAQRWIPVEERLPEIINGMEYYDAVVEGEEFVEIALWDGWHKTWNLYDGGDSYSCTTFVTHWRERPTLPEVYGKEREE